MSQKADPSSKFGLTVRQCLSDLVYGSFAATLVVIFRLFFRVRVVGRENCPQKGPLLVVSNHLSEWDPPFLGAFVPWQVHWLAKVELFELLGGKMNGFFQMLHCVPVDREKADLSAVKKVVRLLKGSRPVAVFAEGGVRNDETSLLGSEPMLKEGAATMAILAGSPPILPILLNGTMGLYRRKTWFSWRRHQLEIVIGAPFTLESKDRYEATKQILNRLLELKTQLIEKKMG